MVRLAPFRGWVSFLQSQPTSGTEWLRHICRPIDWGFQCGEELLQLHLFPSSTTGNGLVLHVLGDNRCDAGGEAAKAVSPDGDCLLDSIRHSNSKPVLPSVLQYQLDSLNQAFPCQLLGSSLAVGSGYFGTIRREPIFIPFNDCKEFIPHL